MIFNHEVVDKFIQVVAPMLPPDLCEDYIDDDEESELQLLVKRVDPFASIKCGVSKMVILSSQLENFVIKIPFKGSYEYNSSKEQDEWSPFCWAPSFIDTSDYCLAEYEKYQKLKIYGLNCFVAKTYFYKTVNDFRIFVQERVTPLIFDTKDRLPSDRASKIAQLIQKDISLDTKWLANCIDVYGSSKLKRFLYYCKNIDLDLVQDCHRGNYGYRGNGTPCFLDYSGFLDY